MTQPFDILRTLFLVAGLAAPASAQVAPVPTAREILTQAIKDKAQTAIKRFIPEAEFRVECEVEPSNLPLPQTPYVPATAMPATLSMMDGKALSGFVASMRVRVFLAERYTAKTRTDITELLTTELALDQARGDQVTFSAIGFEVQSQDAAAQRQLSESAAELRQARFEMQSALKERNDIRTELTVTKSDLDQLKREYDRVAQQVRPQEESAGTTAVPAPASSSFWKDNAGILVGGLLITLALFLLSRSLAGMGVNLGQAFTQIAKNIDLSSLGPRPQAPVVLEQAALPPAPKGGVALQPSPIVIDRLAALRTDLKVILQEPHTEEAALAHLAELAQSPDGQMFALLSLELLDLEQAKRLHQHLGVDARNALAAPAPGSHGLKAEMMLEAGESLKTRVLANYLNSSRNNLDHRVTTLLISMATSDLVQATGQVDSALMPRLFAHLPARRLSQVLNQLRAESPDLFARAADQIHRIADTEAQPAADQALLQILQGIAQSIAEDTQRPYFAYYRELIESSDDEAASEILRSLSANPRLRTYLSANVIVFDTFFRLTQEIQERIVATLNNRQLAAILPTLSGERRVVLSRLLPERRQAPVNAEVARLAERGTAQVDAKAARQEIVRLIRLEGAGRPLAALFASTPSESGPRRDERAAA